MAFLRGSRWRSVVRCVGGTTTALLVLFTTNALLFAQEATRQTLLAEARRLHAEQHYEEAREAYKKVLEQDKHHLKALRGLGEIAMAEEDWGDVKDYHKKILDIRPNDLGARYALGVAYRETGKFKALLLRKLDFDASRKHFDRVLEVDSTFQDVVLQRALLERRKDDWEEAVLLGHRQLALKPTLVEAHVGLFKLYNLLLVHESDAPDFLRKRRGPWSTYFLAEYHRRQGHLSEADSLFQNLLKQEKLNFSRTPIWLSLVRLELQHENDDRAHRYLQTALDSIHSHLDAAFWFETCKYIFTDEELADYRDLQTMAAKREFFQKFWRLRDPLPAAATNVRALEHFRRLLYAEKNYWFDDVRAWINNPDQVGHLSFPQVYKLNEEFNDKGLIYIRHGEPDDRAVTVDPRVPTNESWHYFERGDRPEYIFHFMIARDATGNNWRLAPYLDDPIMIADRLTWDSRFHRMYNARSQLDFNSLLHEAALESEEDVAHAMAHDYHTWAKDTRPLTVPHYWAYFRGEGGKTRLELYTAVPWAELEADTGEVRLEEGFAVYDLELNEVARRVRTVNPEDTRRRPADHGYWIRRFVTKLPPGSYRLAFHVKRLEPLSLGGGTFDTEVPDFSAPDLAMSDLQLAYQIPGLPALGGGAPDRSSVLPNPSKSFATDEPLFLYYEIYNLRPDADGQTRYRIEYVVTQLEKKKSGLSKLFGFLGGGKKSELALEEERVGEVSEPVEATMFDVSELEAGRYALKVRVTDLHAESTAEASMEFVLEEE